MSHRLKAVTLLLVAADVFIDTTPDATPIADLHDYSSAGTKHISNTESKLSRQLRTSCTHTQQTGSYHEQ